MIVVLLILALAVAVGLAAGGSLRNLEHITIHWWALAPIGLGLQMVRVPGGSASRVGLAAATLVASYVLLLAVVVVNRRVPGAALMAAGLVLNLAVVAANGGMPVSRDAIRAAGGSAREVAFVEEGAKHHLMSSEDVLRPLGDVIPVPRPVGTIFSFGDVLLYTGMAWFLIAVTRGRGHENLRPPARWFLLYRGKHAPLTYRLPARYRTVRPAVPAATARSGTGR
jgi:hypothetical protein